MRKFKPAPKQASANRIRERYLHQLGLQRGAASSTSQQQHWDDHHNNNHVVVISGLPSLPEDRATNDNVLESHDFSHADGSYISCYGDEGSCSGGGGNKHQSAAIAIGPPQHLYQPYPPQGDSSHCSRSTLSTSPHTNNTHHLGNNMADENMTSMALACPHSLLKSNGGGHVNNNGTTNNTTNNSSGSSSALPFSLSWGTSQLSRSAAVLLDEAGGSSPSSSSAPIQRPNNDHDSVSSAATATTAESSFTATMVSRDWGASGGATNNIVAIPHHPPSGTASVSSMGDSVTSAPGVFFQARGGPSSNYASTGPAHCVATSSLASALNRFNIDSDCEASVASNSIIDDPTMMMDDCHIDDSASCASHMSGGSSISIASTSNTNNKPRTATKKKKKKIGKNQRLLDRASAHERMMQMRNDRSQKLRAGMVHSQRASHCSLGGLPMPHQLGGGGGAVASSPARSCSSSVVSQASSIPLMHVDHQATPMSTPVAAMCNIGDPNNNMVMMMQGSPYLSPVLPKRPSFGGSDLGRTPTASNCSQQHTKTTLPAGVHYLQGANCGPLNYHPQLVSKIHMPPPPNVMAMSPPPSASSLPSWSNTDRRDDAQSNSSQVSEMETNLANVVSSMQHSTQEHAVPPSPPSIVKRAAESVEDDVMEVAVTLSMLGGGRTTPSNGGGGMIPRVR